MTTITGATLAAKPNSLFAYMRRALCNVAYPYTWDGLTQEQFSEVVAALECGNERQARVRIVWCLLGMTWWRPMRVAAFFVCLTGRERFQLLRLADPFINPGPMALTKVPTMKVRSPRSRMVTTLHLCVEDLLNELDSKTWGLVDACLLRHQAKPDLDHLRAMAAYLYVKAGTTKEARLKGASVKYANWLSSEQLHLVERQWRLQRLVLERESPAAFSVAQKRVRTRKLDWDSVLMELSGEVLGTLTQTSDLPARTVLKRLNNEIVDNADLKRRIEELKHRKR